MHLTLGYNIYIVSMNLFGYSSFMRTQLSCCTPHSSGQHCISTDIYLSLSPFCFRHLLCTPTTRFMWCAQNSYIAFLWSMDIMMSRHMKNMRNFSVNFALKNVHTILIMQGKTIWRRYSIGTLVVLTHTDSWGGRNKDAT